MEAKLGMRLMFVVCCIHKFCYAPAQVKAAILFSTKWSTSR